MRNQWTHTELTRWKWVLLVCTTFLFATRTLMPICSVKMAQELHWDRRTTGTVLGAFFWGYMSMQFLAGTLADKFGGQYVLAFSALGWSTVMLLTPFLVALSHSVPDYQQAILVATRVCLGLCQAFHFPSMGSLTGRQVPIAKRTSTWAFLNCGNAIGILLSGTVGSFLNEMYSWQLAFITLAIPGLIWVVLYKLWFLKSSSRYRNVTITLTVSDDKLHYETIRPQTNSPEEARKEQPLPWGKLLSAPAFWAMLAGHFSVNNCFYILLSWMPTYFHDQFPAAQAWVFNVVPWILSIPATLLSGYVGDLLISKKYTSVAFVRKLMTTVALIGSATMLWFISYTQDYTMALVCLAVAYLCISWHSAGIPVNPHDIAPQHGGAVFGLMNLAGAIPGYTGVYITGYILQNTQSWRMVFLSTGTVNCIGWLLYVIFGTADRVI